MYYPNLTAEIKRLILKRFPNAKPTLKDVDTITDNFEMACHLLWILDQIQTTEGDDMKNIARRGRWMGYVQSRAETLGLLTNYKDRMLTRVDVQFPQ